MLRRNFLSGLAAAAPALPAFAQGAAKPNVVVLLCDDLGTGDVSCYNPEGKVKTPNFDRVAKEGVRFTDAHSPSSVCTPTRYGLLTGQYAWRTRLKKGVLNGYSPNLIEPGRPTVASTLKQAGYRTGGFGKWHLGLGTSEPVDYAKPFSISPLDHGFDEYYGIPASLDMPPYVFLDGRKAVEPPTSTIAGNHEGKGPRGPFWRGGPSAPGFSMESVIPNITSRAVEFLGKQSPKDPFFTYIPMPAPHTPWVPSKAFQGKHRLGIYMDFITELDDSLGRILNTLKQTGTLDNTLLIVTSDNGAPWSQPDMDAHEGHRANMLWRGQKSDIYEAGHRIPFLVRYPGKAKAGTVSQATVCLTDIHATAAQAAGLPVPKQAEDSYSILPALSGNAQPDAVRPHIVHHSGDGIFSIRQGPWKLTMGLGSGGFTVPKRIEPKPGEPNATLFNLAQDPYEKDDVYKQNPQVVARLSALLKTIQER
ncbi:MAG: arylsulfatase [Bryobacter sp.]